MNYWPYLLNKNYEGNFYWLHVLNERGKTKQTFFLAFSDFLIKLYIYMYFVIL